MMDFLVDVEDSFVLRVLVAVCDAGKTRTLDSGTGTIRSHPVL